MESSTSESEARDASLHHFTATHPWMRLELALLDPCGTLRLMAGGLN
jgi:hypothetical protein